MMRLPPRAEMERAYLGGDPTYDGIFFLAVRTTGVFCRPTCRARKPRPENVEFYATAERAQRAGYRACRRCRPLEAAGRPPEWVAPLLRRLERGDAGRLSDEDLRALGVDPIRARRFFRRQYGMTFQAYQRARRLGAALTAVAAGDDLTHVGLQHGYESTSGFRDAFTKAFGQPPGRARSAARVVAELLESPVGPLLVAADATGLVALEFADPGQFAAQAQRVCARAGARVTPGTNVILRQAARELDAYFAGKLQRFATPLRYTGTEFQCACWRALCAIPYGATISYEELARRAGRPGAQRAAGMANNRNRIAILIPCHRVVNKSGQLGGYGGGLWRKQFLLDLERGALARN